MGGKWTSFFLAKTRKQEKKNQPQAPEKGKTKLSYAFRLRIKNDDLPESIFLHLFPFLTFLETNTSAFLPNWCYSKTLWIPVSLILHVDHSDRSGTVVYLYPRGKGDFWSKHISSKVLQHANSTDIREQALFKHVEALLIQKTGKNSLTVFSIYCNRSPKRTLLYDTLLDHYISPFGRKMIKLNVFIILHNPAFLQTHRDLTLRFLSKI